MFKTFSKNIIVFLLFQICVNLCYCQKREGFIICLNGDTIKGKICYPSLFSTTHTVGPMDQVFQKGIDFMDINGKKSKFFPSDLKGFSIKNNGQDQFYESVDIKQGIQGLPVQGPFFISRIETGDINVYKYCISNIYCNNKISPWEYTYLIFTKNKNYLLNIADPCNNMPLFDKITEYLGFDHPISKFINESRSSGDNIGLQQIILSINQFNTGDTLINKNAKIGQWYCDTCHCNVLLVKKKKTQYKERKSMYTYAPEGFYMYEGFLYNFKFRNHKLFRGVLVKIAKDTIIVTNNFNEAVAHREGKSFDTLTFSVSQLEKIHFPPNLVGFVGKNITLHDYTIEEKNITGMPLPDFSVIQYGQIKKVKWLFAGENIYQIYERDGFVYWLGG